MSNSHDSDGYENEPAVPAYLQNLNEPKLTMSKVAEVMIEVRGNKSAACRRLFVSRGRLNDFINTHPPLINLLNDLREELIDRAEENVFAYVEAGDLGASKFVLTLLGRERGWLLKEPDKPKEAEAPVIPTIIFEQVSGPPVEMVDPDAVLPPLRVVNDG